MGLYDFRCTVSGISLKGIDAVLVALQRDGGRHRPIALGISGSYNRLGSIDYIDEDVNTELVFAYFMGRLSDGRFVVDPYQRSLHEYPPPDLEGLLNYFERNISDSTEEEPAAALSGRPVVFSLVAAPVWAALTAAYRPDAGTPQGWFKHVFGDSVVPGDIYRGRIDDVAEHVCDLYAVDDFLLSRGLRWEPPVQEDDDPGQHYGEELRLYLDRARRAFHDVPVVLAALDTYAEQVRDLLEDDEDDEDDE